VIESFHADQARANQLADEPLELRVMIETVLFYA
jgi:hypothetical protein